MKAKRKYTRKNLVKSVKKVALVDDHPVFRLGLAGMLSEFDDIEICFEAANGIETLDKLKTHVPDVILLDADMPLMDGLETCQVIRKNYPAVKILVLTLRDDEDFVARLMQLGCNGYLLKDYQASIMAEAIFEVAENHYFYRAQFSKSLHKKVTRSNMQQPVAPGDVLTEREKEIVQLICCEYNNKEIAALLNISTRTVERHRENIQLKMGVKNTVGLVMYAIRNRLVK